MSDWIHVTTAAELTNAVRNGAPAISVDGVLRGMPSLTLPPGTRLRGGTLEFGARGIRLTGDNVLKDPTVRCPPHEPALALDPAARDLGVLELRHVRTTGQVHLVTDRARSGHVAVTDLAVEAADVRGRLDRPGLSGVEALQGAFTLWNRDPDTVLTAELLDISAGSPGSPVRGSGVFVGGAVRVSTLRTGGVHTDGGIPPLTPDLVSGGVFVVTGARVDHVHCTGPVTTHGPNDMVLDNWGAVREWTASAPLTSHGPSGVGFVNFGDLDRLDVRAPITTHGAGARGFNFYAGTLRHASFGPVTTTGDGAVGLQIARPLPRLEIDGDLTTEGGAGTGLVRGVQTTLRAVALSVKPGGHVGTVTITGRIRTLGDGLDAIELEGTLETLHVTGGVHALGRGSTALRHHGDAPDLTHLDLTAPNGTPVVDEGGEPGRQYSEG